MKRSTTSFARIGAIGCGLAMAVALYPAQADAAAFPDRITHQGRLFEQDGTPVSATMDVTFTIWDAAQNGASEWTETHNVDFDEGYFSVELGTTIGFDGS